jgi:deoxyhypusine synthase
LGEKYVEQIPINIGMRISDLLKAMGQCGVLGAGRLGRALDVVVEIFGGQDYTVFLAMAGPMVPGGLRRVVQTLLEGEFVDALVVSGANVVHDITEALGYRGLQASFPANDVKLRRKSRGRAGDIVFQQEGFVALEKATYKVLESISSRRENISVSELLAEFGSSIEDEESILRTASRKRVPVFCPTILDSMLGLHIWTYSQTHPLRIDFLKDMSLLEDMMYDSKRVGAIILGGGVPKHFLLGASMLRDGLDAAVQITLDRPEGGSLSGAPLEEAISWRKARVESRIVTVIGDATIVFPVLALAAMETLSQRG